MIQKIWIIIIKHHELNLFVYDYILDYIKIFALTVML